MLFLDSGFTTVDVVTSVPKEADVCTGQRICTPLYAWLASRLRFDRTSRICQVEVLHLVP